MKIKSKQTINIPSLPSEKDGVVKKTHSQEQDLNNKSFMKVKVSDPPSSRGQLPILEKDSVEIQPHNLGLITKRSSPFEDETRVATG